MLSSCGATSLSDTVPRVTHPLRHVQRFVDAWRGEFEYHQGIDENLIRERGNLMTSTPPTWASGADSGYITPGPLPMTVRAMSYVMVYAATQLEESAEDRAASCFAKGQLRCVLCMHGVHAYVRFRACAIRNTPGHPWAVLWNRRSGGFGECMTVPPDGCRHEAPARTASRCNGRQCRGPCVGH